MSIEAMKQALEALEELRLYPETPEYFKRSKAITSLRQAIKEHALREVQRLGQEIEQEPVTWSGGYPELRPRKHHDTHPPQRKPLTDEQIAETFCKAPRQTQNAAWFAAGVRYAEAVHGIKEES